MSWRTPWAPIAGTSGAGRSKATTLAGSMLLRVLDAVGVQLVPTPPASIPRAVNAALGQLEAQQREAADEAARRHEQLVELIGGQREELTGDQRSSRRGVDSAERMIASSRRRSRSSASCSDD